MNTKILKASALLVATLAMALGGTASARADDLVDAKVPFPFFVGDVRLPAGSYIVKEISGSGVVEVVSADNHQAICTLTIPSQAEEPTARAELIFKKFGNDYFLARVVPEGGNEREIILTPSMMQREAAKNSDRATH